MFLKPVMPSFQQIGFDLTWHKSPSCTTPFSGHAIDTQGWTLRRCLSCLNRVASKPHCPREPEIREILSHVGIVWEDPPAHDQQDGDGNSIDVKDFERDDLEEFSSEEGEEEQVTDDEVVAIPLEGAGAKNKSSLNNLVGYALVYCTFSYSAVSLSIELPISKSIHRRSKQPKNIV